MGGYVKKKKDMVFQSVDSLQQIVNVVNEAAAAVNDSKRTIKESAIPEVLAGALGAGIGGVGSFAALYGLGVVGLSAAGITSGLAAAGAVVGGGMVAGIFVLAAPIAALAAGGVGVAAHLKNKQLRQEKERLYRRFLLSQGVLFCLSQTHLDRKEGVGRKILEFFFEPLQKLISFIHKGVPGHIQPLCTGSFRKPVRNCHEDLVAFRVG